MDNLFVLFLVVVCLLIFMFVIVPLLNKVLPILMTIALIGIGLRLIWTIFFAK